ncbi:hypothetical protein FRACA_260028 [Frankia canadensis]|uniref:Uncharacterized protein n=1 Tax=Frankia canadensis TaxID=1836972 RepID=A0A2I2KSD9_9ACTN|nr:hypothetical protein FRACA_260028 [Frankia canadensis]SOU55865.1 hypothetical protein FRACA_260028 [Frankia canadensis]
MTETVQSSQVDFIQAPSSYRTTPDRVISLPRAAGAGQVAIAEHSEVWPCQRVSATPREVTRRSPSPAYSRVTGLDRGPLHLASVLSR